MVAKPTPAESREVLCHHCNRPIDVAVGAHGEMITAARPTGRAQFPGGACDVQARGGALERGAKVVVRKIDGPIVFVDEASSADARDER